MLRLTARYVFPVDRPPLAGGVVTIEGERIVAVEPHGAGEPALDLGNVALIPGLVNAHTHLEFSDALGPLGISGMPFPRWLPAVIEYRTLRNGPPVEAVT